MLDTLLAGWEGVTASYLLHGESAAVVDPGARTSAQAVRDALAAAGVGPDDLRWIVLTHIHLDHCGATGILAGAFPHARVVVHRRGVRHLVDPSRLVAGTVAVHRERWSLYGGLDPTDETRIDAADDGHAIDLGGGRRLRLLETPGHTRTHMAVVDERTGTVLAGDALGLRLRNAGPYPTLPPSDIDPPAGRRSLARIRELAPPVVAVSHFGPVPDPQEALDAADEQLATVESVALAAPDRAALQAALEARMPVAETVRDPDALALLARTGWPAQSVDGLLGWAARARAREAEVR